MGYRKVKLKSICFTTMIQGLYVKKMFKSSVESLSHICLFATPWIAACQASLSLINSQSLLKLMSIESVMHLILCLYPLSNHLICHPLLLLP